MKPRSIVNRSFWCGYLLHLSYNCFLQDFMGKEAFLAHAKDHWWDTHWSLWVVLTLVILAYYLSMYNRLPGDKS